jgi:ribosome recycling factor
MMNEIKKETESRMKKTVEALESALGKIRTGRAHPSILNTVHVDYYGSSMPLTQVANVTVEDSRTLTVTPWEKPMVPAIEKAILNSGLGLNPSTAGTVIRVPLPALTEETRKNYIRQSKAEAETARVSVRNIRRDANTDAKNLLKDKSISEDDERRGQDDIQKLTDKFIALIDQVLDKKEKDLMEI